MSGGAPLQIRGWSRTEPGQKDPGQEGEETHQGGTIEAELQVCQQAAETGDGIAPDGQLIEWVASRSLNGVDAGQ